MIFSLKIKQIFLIILLFIFFNIKLTDSKECVILLHGLGRTERSMYPVGDFLKKNGYEVFYVNYKSTKYCIEDLCSLYIGPKMQALPDNFDKVHFVTHSMGGILARYYLQNNHHNNIDRIVMLAPPNQGSDLSDFLIKNLNFLYKPLNGPAGQQLSTDSSGIGLKLQPVNNEIGIIAGSRSWEPWLSVLIQGKNDGKVSIKNTQLSGMKDFIIVPHTHTFLMNCKDVHVQVLSFLKSGQFDK